MARHDFAGCKTEGAEILKAWELEREAERQRWRQEAERRAEIERLAQQEEERWSRFVAAAQTWREAEFISQLISELERMPRDDNEIVGDKIIKEWLA
jgi:uncharacterized protein YigA (DUF484 family)